MLALKVFLHTQSGLSTFSKKETTPMHKVDSYKWLKNGKFFYREPQKWWWLLRRVGHLQEVLALIGL